MILTLSRENLILFYANNKGADQNARPRILISAVVIRFPGSSITSITIYKVSTILLVSKAEHAGLKHTQPQSQRTVSSASRPISLNRFKSSYNLLSNRLPELNCVYTVLIRSTWFKFHSNIFLILT